MSSDPSRARPQRWAYRVEDGMEASGEYMRRMDAEGWDLVSVTQNTRHVLARGELKEGRDLFTFTWRMPWEQRKAMEEEKYVR